MISSLPTIPKAREMMNSGDLSPVDLVEFCLQRIQLYDGEICAWVMVDEVGARKAAREAAAALSRQSPCGPLHGIPIGIKDIFDVAGWPTKAGSLLRQHHIAPNDAAVVGQLRGAGAIILGKTVTTEFACFDPSPTRNPWNFQHTPGGSSSGSAAAVATQMCMAALGSQTGGSITRPASYCGVAGLKPTFDMLAVHGVVPVSRHLDTVGVIARQSIDLQSVFAALQKRPTESACRSKGSDPVSQRARAQTTGEFAEISGDGMVSLSRIDEYFWEGMEANLGEVVESLTLKNLEISSLAPFRLPDSFRDLHQMHRRIMAVEAAAYHRDVFVNDPDAFGKNIGAMIREGLDTTAVDYANALKHQQQFQAEMNSLLKEDLILVTPATSTTAPQDLSTTGDSGFQTPWSYAGLPTVSIPCGMTRNGLPCAIQLIGSRLNEQRLLRQAILLETQWETPQWPCGE
ncbi:MAG: amidase [Pirellulaceae bacterium]|nr:amidase [Pirellulaceae bacterium]